MKAIVIQEVGGPEVMRISEVPDPQPKGNEAVIKIAYSGVNFIDVYFREGRYKAQLPFTLGQEAAGTVVAVGSDVKALKAGDRVAQTTVMGSYAELQAVPVEKLVKIPEGVSDQHGRGVPDCPCFSESQVHHAQQDFRPVLGLGAAGAGLDVDEGRVRVHLAGEHATARPRAA